MAGRTALRLSASQPAIQAEIGWRAWLRCLDGKRLRIHELAAGWLAGFFVSTLAMAKIEVEVELSPEQWIWLGRKVEEQSLPDKGKAFRCCVNFVAQTERTIPAGPSAATAADPVVLHKLEAAKTQADWIATEANSRGVISAAFAGAIVRECMALPSQQVFGVVRCKSATNARGSDVAGLAGPETLCEGAQAALAATDTADLQRPGLPATSGA